MAMDLGNTKVQLVAAQEGFRDEELFVPEDVFSDAGAFVDIASNDTRTAHGMLGGEVDPDIAIFRIDVDSSTRWSSPAAKGRRSTSGAIPSCWRRSGKHTRRERSSAR